jgi:hypothetical protein
MPGSGWNNVLMMNFTLFAAIVSLMPATALASAMPYVKPESLWPFHTFEGVMLVLGFFAVYRAVRSHLPPGDGAIIGKADTQVSATDEEYLPPMHKRPNKDIHQVVRALRVAGLVFMVVGSFLGFHSGGVDYGPAHLDELTTRIFGGALFLVGLSEFFILPKLIAGKSPPE